MTKSITRRRVLVGAAASATALTIATQKPALAAKTHHEIQIKEFAFEPSHVQVRVGDTLKWTNADLAPHTATADEFGWDTGEITKGESAELIVTKDMETSYFCAFHPHMKATIEIL